VLLVLNASPYHLEKQDSRHQIARDRVAQTGLALVYCNLVGGQDELVFDGGSFVLDRSGELVQQLPAFEEALALVELDLAPSNYANVLPAEVAQPLSIEAAVYRALSLGLKDYVTKITLRVSCWGFLAALILR